MKLIYAKLWLKKFIKYNVNVLDDKSFELKLNKAIINLSHRVFRAHSLHGHDARQDIRLKLQKFVARELKYYNKVWIIKNPNHGYTTQSPVKRLINFLRHLYNKL